MTAGPNYSPQEMHTPEVWQKDFYGIVAEKESEKEILAKWWTTFNDPVLSSLKERAVAGNLKLKKTLSLSRSLHIDRLIQLI